MDSSNSPFHFKIPILQITNARKAAGFQIVLDLSLNSHLALKGLI